MTLTLHTPHEHRIRYEFFEKGTKIDVIKENYDAIDFNTTKILKGTQDQKDKVDKMCKEAEDAEHEWEEAKKLLRYASFTCLSSLYALYLFRKRRCCLVHVINLLNMKQQ